MRARDDARRADSRGVGTIQRKRRADSAREYGERSRKLEKDPTMPEYIRTEIGVGYRIIEMDGVDA